jgi:benzoyl-CoA reductase/2-hydroxyglutaryl-CoA dehydratase subunit BcrC/BadD/HgdB
MREMLTLCGYEDHEIDAELPRLQKAFAKLGIMDEDLKRGKQRLATFYDMELKGVRKIFRLYVKELVNITLAKEEGKKTIIHGCMTPTFEVFGSALATHTNDVGVMVPNSLFMVVFGCVFGKFVPILEAAERQWMKGGLVSHCGMVKTRVGLLALNLIPKPDLMVTSGSLCETSPKTNDLFHAFYDIPTYYHDTCQDRPFEDYPDSTRAMELSAASMRKMTQRIQEYVGFEITDDMLWEVIRVKDEIAEIVDRIRKLIRNSDPVPIGSTHENLLAWFTPVPLRMDYLLALRDAVTILYEELKERVHKGEGVLEKGAPKLMAVCPNHHADPRLERLVNASGMAIVATDMEFTAPLMNSKDPKDPYETLSQHINASLSVPLGGRLSIILEACKELKVDGVLNHYHVGCRSVAGDAFIIEEAIKKELGIPVLTLEWENFDPRVYDHEQYKTRVEVFRSMIVPGA